jgi:glycosyltransferase involved in cell wall biosynthesis
VTGVQTCALPIFSNDPLLTGLISLILGKLINAKVVIEVNGNFESAFKYGSTGKAELTFEEKIKDKLSKHIIRFTLKRADTVKLVSHRQLKPLMDVSDINKIKSFSFPNFVPIQYFMNESPPDKRYVLLVGFPWYLKGVDILIKAFNNITAEFPDLRLKVVGWCPSGRDFFENLTQGNPNIELCNPVPRMEVVKLMNECSLYVLASRTDASPRVLREAMASKKPIIAANIDGIPELVINNYNGILFEKENVDDLTQKMRMILYDKTFADKIAKNGFEYVQRKFSEKIYIKQYKEMIESIVK